MLPPALTALLGSFDALPGGDQNPMQSRLREELLAVSDALGDRKLPGIALRLEPWAGPPPGRCFICGR